MEEIAQELQNISSILTQSQSPLWLTYLSALGPLVLTWISALMAYIQHEQNKSLQKQIANRDFSNLLRQNVLEIYNSYFNGLRVVSQAIGNVTDIFSSAQSMQQWIYDLQRAYDALSCSYNQAKLMLDDESLLQVLEESFNRFNKLNICVNQYYHNGLAYTTMNNAWAAISQKYGIAVGDYLTLSQNLTMMEEFWKLCDNRHIQDIHREMEAFKASMEDKKFDEQFKKYIQMKQL